MSVAVEAWRAVERWNPLQQRAADGTWGDDAGRLLGDQGVAYMGRNDDGGFNLGIGSAAFRGRGREDDSNDSGDVFGHTAQLSPAAVQDLHARLSAATADGQRRNAYLDEHWDEIAVGDSHEIVASGYISGDGADVHYSVEVDDPSVGVETYLAVIPHSSDATLEDLAGAEQAAVFDPVEMRRFLARLGSLAGTTESEALALWRALEARHNLRGPDGRFIKDPGGSDRPSLADVIRGTAAGGPKRQRGDKGGMSVADAVRSAARRSDSTGRPTQRTPEQHRAEGGHAVADEVDRALAEAGVPDDVRRQVAARARAVADSNGKTPSKSSTSRPAAKPSRPRAAALDGDRLKAISGQLAAATSRDEARRHLAGLTASQLRQVAGDGGVSVGSGDTKARLLDRITNDLVGRRLDSAAIDRMTRR